MTLLIAITYKSMIFLVLIEWKPAMWAVVDFGFPMVSHFFQEPGSYNTCREGKKCNANKHNNTC